MAMFCYLKTFAFMEKRKKMILNLQKNLPLTVIFIINDAFGSAHRAHASTEGVTHFIIEMRRRIFNAERAGVSFKSCF